MYPMEEKIRKLIEAVPGDKKYKRFRLSNKTWNDYFGPGSKQNYSKEFIEMARYIPITLDDEAPDGEIYCFYIEPEPPYECEECGEEIDQPGLCVFCFAIASIGE